MQFRPFCITFLAASAVVLTGACGSAESTTPRAAKPSASTPSTPPEAKPMSEEQLSTLLVAGQDLPGHKVEEAMQGGLVSADRPECRDLATLLLGGAMTGTGGQVHTQAVKGGTVTKVSLHSWFGTKAGTILADVKAGGAKCGSGFNALGGTGTIRITKVVADSTTRVGDESVAITAEQQSDGKKSVIEAVMVRKGTTIASFTAHNASAATEKPAVVVTAQMSKLNS
ncbi:hypothetical protein [Streptomyces sp. NPDC057939]|uniref:hypothetical protein n=1 Tax=Streptomyces sp. NPDC057939 TaxID=3346284 RepID=UPI0036E68D4D